MDTDLGVMNYVRNRENGLLSKYRSTQLSVQQNLIINNEFKTELLRNNFDLPSYNTKAFLIVMSIDKSYFAVATSENTVGIYCSLSGNLKYKLIGSQCPIYTISWHPYFKNIIACSNFSGSVLLWDIFQSSNSECSYQKKWNWSPLSSITYSIGFHPFRPIMTLARDREIRFIDWEKNEHIAHWRFYSEFSWVPWVSWSFVGSNIIVSIGNPQNDCVLNSIMESINLDQKSLSPIESGCVHYNHNSLCETCDTCEKMSMLDFGPPSFEEYRVNAVDLIRFVLSRNDDWFAMILICMDCRFRFKLWADSIQLHSKYDMDSSLNRRKSQLPHDIDSTCVTVIESPIAPEIVWEHLQKLDINSISDKRLKKYLIPKSDTALNVESKNLLRCITMFQRECLRQSICWCCIQQIHNWILQQEDLCLFLYESMIQVRTIVMERIKEYDLNMYKRNDENQEHKENETINEWKPKTETNVLQIDSALELGSSQEPNSSNHDKRQPDQMISPGLLNNDESIILENNIYSIESLGYNKFPNSLFNLSSSSTPPEDNQSEINDGRKRRLTYLHLTLKFLQLYISEPSKLGDLINIILENNLSQSGMLFGPSLNGTKIDSYSVRKWHLKPIGTTSEKISPRNDLNECSVVVQSIILSDSGLTESSIRMSKCGRTIAVFVPHKAFQRLHSIDLGSDNANLRKRRYSLVFNDDMMPTDDHSSTSPSPVVAIYSSEPESSCGQLLYYFEMPYNPISIDFSPLGDHLIIGLSGSQNQACIGLILKIDNSVIDQRVTRNRKMHLKKIINHDNKFVYSDLSNHFMGSALVNCVIWNTAGGLLYTKEPGIVCSLSFTGCTK